MARSRRRTNTRTTADGRATLNNNANNNNFGDAATAAAVEGIDSSSEEEEEVVDEKSKVKVKIGTKLSLARVLKSLRRQKKTGKVLEIAMDPFHTFGEDALRTFVMKVVDALPLVVKVEIATDHAVATIGRTAIWPISILTDMLEKWIKKKRELLWIRLCFVQVAGNWSDFYSLSQTLKSVESLEKFNLDKVSLTEYQTGPIPTQPGCWLNPIIETLAKLPRLLHVRILGTRDFGPPPGDDQGVILQDKTLRLLCESSSLRSLCLIHFNLTCSNVQHMAKALLSNKVLQELDIDCTLENKSCHALTDLMERKTALEDLNLCVRCKTDESEEERITNALAGGNEDPSSQLTPQQQVALSFEDEMNERLARGVGNSTLINFALFRGRISSKSQDAFREMVAKQFHLESLTLYTGDENLNKTLADDRTIAFYVKVNYFGRYQFLKDQVPVGRWRSTKSSEKAHRMRLAAKRQPQTRKAKHVIPPPTKALAPDRCIVDTLARVKGDVSCLFYLLSAKPFICERALQKMNQQETEWNAPKRRVSKAPEGEPPSKRTRRYRAAKYRCICYKEL